MLLIILLIFIISSVVVYLRNKDYDARVNYGKNIADSFDLKDIFETAYLGSFGFDEEPPHEELRKDIEVSFDRGVETRLAFHFAKTLPKWVLQAGVKGLKSGQYGTDGSYAEYIEKQIDVFTGRRNLELIDLLNKKATSTPEPQRRRRRRR